MNLDEKKAVIVDFYKTAELAQKAIIYMYLFHNSISDETTVCPNFRTVLSKPQTFLDMNS